MTITPDAYKGLDQQRISLESEIAQLENKQRMFKTAAVLTIIIASIAIILTAIFSHPLILFGTLIGAVLCILSRKTFYDLKEEKDKLNSRLTAILITLADNTDIRNDVDIDPMDPGASQQQLMDHLAEQQVLEEARALALNMAF